MSASGEMTDTELRRRLDCVRRRLIVNRGLWVFAIGVFVGLGLMTLLLVVSRGFGARVPFWVCLVPLGMAPAWLLSLLWLRLPGAFEAAQACDARGALKERLTTWIELAQKPGPVPKEMIELQRRDALAAGNTVEPARLFPVRLPGWVKLIALPMMACGAAMLMPEYAPKENKRWDFPQGIEVTGFAIATPGGQPEEMARPELPAELMLRVQLVVSGSMEISAAERRELLQEVEERLKGQEGASEAMDQWRELLAQLRRQVQAESGTGDGTGGAGSTVGPDRKPGPDAAKKDPPPPALDVREAVALYERDFPQYKEILRRYFAGPEGKEIEGSR